MRKTLLALSAAAVLMVGSSVFADVKIGVVDFNKILADSPQFTAAKADLKAKFDPQEKKIANAQKKFQDAIEAFSKNSPTMKADAKDAEQRKIMQQQQDLQKMQDSFQKDLTETQNKVMKGLLDKIQSIIDKVAVDQNFDLIIPKASAPYSKKGLEITDEIVKQMKGKKGVVTEVAKKPEDVSKKAEVK